MIRCVVFDLGGVMIKIRHTWPEILDELGLEMPQNFESERLANHGLLSAFQNGELATNDFLVSLALEFGVSINEVQKIHGNILQCEYDGATQLVQDLQSCGIKAICLSNTNELHYQEFFNGRFPVCNQFDSLVASHKIGLSKPDHRAFEYVENAFGFRGQDILFFDDHLPNIDSALEFGWQAVRVDPEGTPPLVIRQELVGRGLLPH